MCVEYGFGQAAGFEQCEAQQHGIAHAAPDRHDDVLLGGDVLHQYGVDCHADDNQKRLEAQRQQAAQVVLAHAAPFLAHHGRHRDGGHRRDKVNFDHTAINDDENADIQRPHGNADKKRLEPQAEQRPQVHIHQPGLHIGHNSGDVDGSVRADDAGRLGHHALGHVEHAHDEVPGVGDEQNRGGGFEHPFEDHPGVHVMQVVAVGNHLDQLQRHHDSQDHASNRHHDGVGEVLDHTENAAVPPLRGLAHLYGYIRDLLIYAVEHPR